MSQTPRNHSVTIAKAIAIILMVMGHAGIPAWANHYLSLMRMPLFFFMSGYCFKEIYLASFEGKKWLRKRIKGIYWPYVKWGLFFVLMHNIFIYFHIYSETIVYNGKAVHYYSLQETLLRLLSVITMHGTERLLGGFWFLKALFWGSMIFYATRKLFSNLIICLTLLLLISFFTSYFHLSIPYMKIGSLDFFAAFFIMTGHTFRQIKIGNVNLAERLITNWWLILLFAIVVGVGSVYWPTSMLHYQWYHVVPYAFTAIMGTIILFSIGNWINHWNPSSNQFIRLNIRNFLIYTGGYTFNVLAWHLR